MIFSERGATLSLIAWLIIASEIGFWVVIVLGLITRYIFKRNKLGLFFLALTPVIDLVLLIATSVDLYNGATATQVHGIAAVYIGVSIAFGKSMIRWADERFLYYIAKQGPKPVKRYGMDYAKHYFKSWLRHALAYAIGVGLLFGLVYFIDDPSRTEALSGTIKVWSIVLAIDFIFSVSYFIWPKNPKATK